MPLTARGMSALSTGIHFRYADGAPRWSGDGPGVDVVAELRFDPSPPDEADANDIWNALTVRLRERLERGAAKGWEVTDGPLACTVEKQDGCEVYRARQRCHPPVVTR